MAVFRAGEAMGEDGNPTPFTRGKLEKSRQGIAQGTGEFEFLREPLPLLGLSCRIHSVTLDRPPCFRQSSPDAAAALIKLGLFSDV